MISPIHGQSRNQQAALRLSVYSKIRQQGVLCGVDCARHAQSASNRSPAPLHCNCGNYRYQSKQAQAQAQAGQQLQLKAMDAEASEKQAEAQHQRQMAMADKTHEQNREIESMRKAA